MGMLRVSTMRESGYSDRYTSARSRASCHSCSAMSDPDSKDRPPGTIEIESVQIVEERLRRSSPPGSTVEVQAVQILEERSRRPPPPLPGSTVEVQAVQILDQRACPAQDGTGNAQVVHLDPAEPNAAQIFKLTTEEVDWRRLDPLEADLLVRFAFGATVDAIVRASGVEPDRARGAIDRLIRDGLLVR